MKILYKILVGFMVGSAAAAWFFMFKAGLGSLLGMAFFLIGLIFLYLTFGEMKKEQRK